MRMLIVSWLVIATACEGGERPPPDARECPERPSSETSCYSTCGNGRLDLCWKTMNSHCGGSVYYTMETCEPALSCAALGFCGGTVTCDTDCVGIVATACTPCP